MSLAKEDSPFKKGERIQPFEGWIFDKDDLKKGDRRVDPPFQGWMKKAESQASKMNFKNRFLYEVFNYRKNKTIK